MKKLSVYLSGNMTPDSTHYYDWVSEFSRAFTDSDRYTCTFSKQKASAKFSVEHDLARLSRSDIVVANLGISNQEHSIASVIIEIYEARRQGKIVLGFVSGNTRSTQASSPWVSEFLSHEFPTMQDVIDYLIHEDNLPV